MTADGTIVAQASAQGNSRRGIVRLSGENALDAAAPFFVREPLPNELESNVETLDRKVQFDAFDLTKPFVAPGRWAPWGDETPARFVRCALFYWPQGRGFTGERAVELHLPGAPPILDASIRTICGTKLARLATRGEFTLRAFLSGRLDLTRAEAILGAIDARSDSELRVALAQLGGSLEREITRVYERIFDALTDLEAGFDFAEEDIEFVSYAEIRARLQEAIQYVDETLRRARTQIASDRTPRVVFAGLPNAGKSSLFNKIVELKEGQAPGRALVSDVAGTTRDYLEAEFNVDGLRFQLIDDAGVESPDASNAPRALAQQSLPTLFAEADLILLCFDPTTCERVDKLEGILPKSTPILRVATKNDLDVQIVGTENDDVQGEIVATSAETGAGVVRLVDRIVATLRARTENGEITSSTAIRCQEALRGSKEALQNALKLLDDQYFQDGFLLASEIRLALDRLGSITGRVHTDDLLDRIFSRFCIGK